MIRLSSFLIVVFLMPYAGFAGVAGDSLFSHLVNQVLVFDNYEVIIHASTHSEGGMAFSMTALEREPGSAVDFIETSYQSKRLEHLANVDEMPLRPIVLEGFGKSELADHWVTLNALQRAIEERIIRILKKDSFKVLVLEMEISKLNFNGPDWVHPFQPINWTRYSISRLAKAKAICMTKRQRLAEASVIVAAIVTSGGHFLPGFRRVPTSIDRDAFKQVLEHIIGDAVLRFRGSTEKNVNRPLQSLPASDA